MQTLNAYFVVFLQLGNKNLGVVSQIEMLVMSAQIFYMHAFRGNTFEMFYYSTINDNGTILIMILISQQSNSWS